MNLQQFTNKTSSFNENSRVWIYQANRILTTEEVHNIKTVLKPFVATWTHHGKSLKADFDVLYNLFVVFVVDESIADVSGCGIDKSVHILKKIGNDLDVDFFDRLAISFFYADKVVCFTKGDFSSFIITEKTWTENNLVFNNQISTLAELKSNWIIPFKNSWHYDFFSTKDSFDLSL